MNTVTVAEATELLAISRQAIHALIKRGTLDSERDARGRVHVSLASIERVRRQQTLRDQGVSTVEAASALGVSERSVRRYIDDGDLAAVLVAGEWRIDRASLSSFTPTPPGRPSKDES